MTLTKKILLLVLITYATGAFAITAPEVFNDGKRAHNLGHWHEAEEIFTRFLETWPDHHLKDQALMHRIMASARNYDHKMKAHSLTLTSKLKADMQSIEKTADKNDLIELKMAIMRAESPDSPLTWKKMEKLSPTELLHVFKRGWHPDPATNPVKTMGWAYNWKSAQSTQIFPELDAHINRIEALALWQLRLSPLSVSANSDIIKTWGYWPVHSALDKAIERSFNLGCPTIRREMALLGYSKSLIRGDFLRSHEEPQTRNKWYIYLADRGINLQEAWCPR